MGLEALRVLSFGPGSSQRWIPTSVGPLDGTLESTTQSETEYWLGDANVDRRTFSRHVSPALSVGQSLNPKETTPYEASRLGLWQKSRRPNSVKSRVIIWEPIYGSRGTRFLRTSIGAE